MGYTDTREDFTSPSAKRHCFVICNACSGSNDPSGVRQTLEPLFADSDVRLTLIEIGADRNFERTCEEAALQAKQNKGVLVAAGGDGTVNHVASLCRRYDLPLGILPLGTFNYFARDIGIPDDLRLAAEVLLHGVQRPVAVGYVNQHLFLNNASFGLYTRIIRNRERDKSHFGRYRAVAFFSGLATLFQDQQPLTVKLRVGDEELQRKTAMVFVGNNTLQLKNFNLRVSECTQHDRLAVIVMKPVSYWEKLRLILRGLLQRLDEEDKLEMLCAEKFEVVTRRKQIQVVVDGELISCSTPLRFSVTAQALHVLVPALEGVQA